MKSTELRKKFIKFFEERGHKFIKSASLVPNEDRTVLFNVAGMQQFKKY
jgi:alanyl-tRNA synthetase